MNIRLLISICVIGLVSYLGYKYYQNLYWEKRYTDLKSVSMPRERAALSDDKYDLLKQIGYDEEIAHEITTELIDVYGILPSVNYTYETVDGIFKKKMLASAYEMRNALFDVKQGIEDSVFHGYLILERNIQIYKLLTGEPSELYTLPDTPEDFELLNDEEKEALFYAFSCNYMSYLGWIYLNADGFNVIPIYLTYGDFPQAMIDIAENELKVWQKIVAFFSSKSPRVDGHAALLVKLSDFESVFFDPRNSYVSNIFYASDYQESNDGEYFLTNQERSDLFKRYVKGDVDMLKAGLWFWMSIYAKAGGSDFLSEKYFNKAQNIKYHPESYDQSLNSYFQSTD